ncbi:MAG: ABC transporter permease subunit [Planctomycetota bacterium]
MKRISGILGLLIYVCVATTLLSDNFVGASNMENIVRWTSLRGILGIGIAFVIITGGIELSLGSMVGLIGCLLPMFLMGVEKSSAATALAWTLGVIGGELLVWGIGWEIWQRRKSQANITRIKTPLGLAAMGAVLAVLSLGVNRLPAPHWIGLVCAVLWALALAMHLGLLHGLLITRMKLQPFIVTLCGWLIYRGLARGITGDQTQVFGTTYNESLRLIAIGKPCFVVAVVVVAGFGLALWALWSLLSERRQLAASTGQSGKVTNAAAPVANSTLIATESTPGLWLFLMTTGLVLALATLSRFVIPNAVDWQLAGFSIKATPEQLPAVILSACGWLVVPIALWLFVRTLRLDFRASIVPLVVAIVSSGLLAGAIWMARQKDDWFGGPSPWNSRLKMTAIFVTLALVMGSLTWFGQVAAKLGKASARLPIVAAAITALLWLMTRQMGSTSLAETLLGKMLVPAPFFILLVLALLAGLLLNYTIHGRYLLALGRNEQAARFSGIKTDRLVLMAYILCALVTGLGAVLFSLDVNSVQPSGHGSSYELFAIAAAVLGGCSLRGGEGTILGVLIGAAVMQALFNAINILGIPSRHDFTILGMVILVGVITDEIVKRLAARRRAQAAME